ncbi:hypothetical protein PGT21_008260 [Puccinia graminis f. sp. tritici]|uniref:Uncharacterized protein n=1 Tax=Puccinia graminis f. sp. tritici TaxID=56615 RepID=A0A5B0QEQ9_PUCGR|nr:hypothetical protein PGT21_008260 [Puccinia graminis f. sp. tritici]
MPATRAILISEDDPLSARQDTCSSRYSSERQVLPEAEENAWNDVSSRAAHQVHRIWSRKRFSGERLQRRLLKSAFATSSKR